MSRGFGPARIEQWMGRAERLTVRTKTVDLGFLISFIPREAMQARILAIALRQQRYSMNVAHERLGRTIHNDRSSIRANYEVVLLPKPEQGKVSVMGRGGLRGTEALETCLRTGWVLRILENSVTIGRDHEYLAQRIRAIRKGVD